MGSLEGIHCRQLQVMVVPFPMPGHVNPMLQFAKQLASKNVGVTFVTTEANRKWMLQVQGATSGGLMKTEVVGFETIPDGLTTDSEREDLMLLGKMLDKIGRVALGNVIERFEAQGTHISCIVQDPFLGWVPEVAKKFNIPWAFFWTQSCGVYSIYHHFFHGKLAIPMEKTRKTAVGIGLPPLSVSDLPSFLQPGNPYSLQVLVNVFLPLPEATWVLGNSFDELESEEIDAMKAIAPIRTVGPLIPSAFFDGRNPPDTESVAHVWENVKCMDWLNAKQPRSVVYVSFGSGHAVLSKEQNHEIALGLKASGYSFLWVIRPTSSKAEIHSDSGNLPEGFQSESSEQGLVVPWCPQLEVLFHPSVGAFMTHCGWNSTLEGLSSGVPMLTVPQWTDQPTNSLCIAEKWKAGLRLSKRSADGVVGRDEVEKGIRIVMESERGIALRMNALRWKRLASEAMVEGGSSDKNIDEFVAEIAAKALSTSDSHVVM
eukprot:PITA_05606